MKNEILEELLNGNKRFVKGESALENDLICKRCELEKSQSPKAIIVACSDSRTPPEILFDQGLGDLFEIRTAGNILSQYDVASIEYAISKLSTKLILVLGHESCGAIKEAIKLRINESAGSPCLNALASRIQTNVLAMGGCLETEAGDDLLKTHAIANTKAEIKSLLNKSSIVKKSYRENKVEIFPAMYSFKTGIVEII